MAMRPRNAKQATPATSGRKIKIKPFSNPPSLPPDFYSRTSSVLLAATQAILRQKPLYAASPPSIEIIGADTATDESKHCNSILSAQPTADNDITRASGAQSPTSALSSPSTVISGSSSLRVRAISREELYKSVESLCVHKFGAHLYQEITKAIDDAALESLARLCADGSATELKGEDGTVSTIAYSHMPIPSTAETLLSAVHNVYTGYTEYLFFVRSIFLYLDRSFVLQHSVNNSGTEKIRPLWEVGIESFRRHLTQKSNKTSCYETVSVAEAIVSALLTLIERDRDGEIVDRALLRDTVRMLCELHLYRAMFVPPLLETSALYYGKEGVRVMEAGSSGELGCSDVSGFLKHVEMRLDQCHEACLEYLEGYDGTAKKVCTQFSNSEPIIAHIGIRKALLSVVEENLLRPHVGVILDPKNCFSLLQDKSRVTPDVRRMYLLLNRIGHTRELKTTFYQYARFSGMEIVQEKAGTTGSSISGLNEKEIVPRLLEWKTGLNYLLQEAFDSQDQFNAAIKDSLETVLNVRGSKMSEWLAKYVDGALRARGGKTGDAIGEDAETALEEVMVLFRHLHSKDVFEAFYQKDLAKRLLHSKSSSIDLERAFLSKLKAECGTGYTSKMEGMFKDMELSRDIMSQYNDHARENKSLIDPSDSSSNRVELDVQVLTTGYWPQYPQYDSIKLPSQVQEHVSHFEKYYDNKYQGRRITWQFSLCNCTLKANFPKKKIDLSVNLFQALVLLSFNESEALTLPQVMTLTGIRDRPELERLLQSLSLGKQGTRVLLKSDYSSTQTDDKPRKVVTDSDIFRYNKDFTNKLNRIKISAIQAKETVHKEQSKVHEQASRDRQYLIDAAIVRIMKARKTIAHRDLIGEVMNQVKHVSRPTGTEIKRRLEGLMEREYLARDESDTSIYNYLA